MEIRIDTSGIGSLEAAWRQAPEIVREEMLIAVVESDSLILRNVQEHTPVGVGGGGGLRGSIVASEEVLSDNIIGTVSTAMPYAIPVEMGSKPHFPPPSALKDWVEMKLGVDPSESDSVAFLVARKIARDGTEGHFMFQRGFADSEQQVVAIYGEATGRIAERMALQ